ncbi:MAG: regulatory protein RecX [Gemmatimonadota bacterium]
MSPSTVDAGIVTELKPIDTSGARFSLATTPGTKVMVSAAIVIEFSLHIGAQLDADATRRLNARVRLLHFTDAAVRSLAARASSSRDLGLKLRRAGAAGEEAATVLSDLTGLGLLDDAAFARTVAERRAAGGSTRGRIAQELRRKGVGSMTAQRAADDAAARSDEDEADLARAAASKRLPSLARLDSRTAKRRLQGFLLRRGYSPRIAATVTRELLEPRG